MNGLRRGRDKLLDTGLALASELSLPVILQRIVDLACEITDARYGAVAMLDEAGSVSSLTTSGLTEQQRRGIGALPCGIGVLALIKDRRPLRIARLSDDPRAAGFPANHPPMESFLGVPVTAAGRVFANIYLTEKRAASEFSVEDEEALVILAGQAGVAIANAVLYEESRSQQRWLEALRRITSAILAGSGVGELLEMVAESSRDLVSADIATIVTPSSPDGGLRIAVASGKGSPALRGSQVSPDHSLPAEVIKNGTPIILENASQDPRAHPPMVKWGVGPTIVVPLRRGGRAFGTLALANQIGGPRLGPAALRLVEAFADQASVAIEYARAQQELERLAVMEERERIAKELHDGIIQCLFAVGMHLQAAASLAEPGIEERIQGAVAEIDHSIRDLRNYIFGLRPGILADHQLAQAIEDIVSVLARHSGLEIEVDIDPGLASDLSPRSAELVQVVREALSNVQRHAEAARCRIELARTPGGATLTIRDDGRGFDPSHAQAGQGLANLHDRARQLGGTLQVSSAPGQGTTLRFALPL